MSEALSHELKWLEVCEHAGKVFSTCSRRQYFAVVLDTEKRVVGTGYNGSPPGMKHCVDGGCPRGLAPSEGQGSVGHGSGYGDCIALHSEANALLYSDRTSRLGGTLIVNGPPCFGCSKLIAGSGLRRVIHAIDDMYADWPKCRSLLESAGITVISVSVNMKQKQGDLWNGVKPGITTMKLLESGIGWKPN